MLMRGYLRVLLSKDQEIIGDKPQRHSQAHNTRPRTNALLSKQNFKDQRAFTYRTWCLVVGQWLVAPEYSPGLVAPEYSPSPCAPL